MVIFNGREFSELVRFGRIVEFRNELGVPNGVDCLAFDLNIKPKNERDQDYADDSAIMEVEFGVDYATFKIYDECVLLMSIQISRSAPIMIVDALDMFSKSSLKIKTIIKYKYLF